MARLTNYATSEEVFDAWGVVADAAVRATLMTDFLRETAGVPDTHADQADLLFYWMAGVAVDGYFVSGEAPGKTFGDDGFTPRTPKFRVSPAERARVLAGLERAGASPHGVVGRGQEFLAEPDLREAQARFALHLADLAKNG